MKPIPLDQLRFGWRDHKSALWWLGLLYRRPSELSSGLDELPRLKGIKVGLALYAHFFPYLLLLCILGRLAVFGLFRTEARQATLSYHLTQIALGIAFGMLLGITAGNVGGTLFGNAKGIALGITVGIVGGITSCITFGSLFGVANGIVGGVVFGIALGIAVGIILGIAKSNVGGFGIANGIAVGIALGKAFGIAFGFAAGFALIVATLRLYYFPLHYFLIWPKLNLRWAKLHPALWDDLCPVPFNGLHHLLAAQAVTQRWRGKYEIEWLIAHYPTQRFEALKAKTMLLARRAELINDLTQLDNLLARLPEGDEGFLTQTFQLRAQVSEIGRLQLRLNTANRPAFQEMYAENLYQAIDSFRSRIQGYHEPLASEFRAAATQWLKLAEQQRAAAREKLCKQPTEQVFRAGDPVNREQEAFAERVAVLEQLEQQVMLSTGCPGIVLYGRRRMGKSTLLAT
jgi:hypothetical protein